jgi:hypothetical protein
MNGQQESKGFWDDAEYVSVYTRAQAIEDGELVDVSELAQEAGFRWPMAFTRALWATIEKIDKRSCQDVTGRTWDVLSVARWAIRRGQGNQAGFKVKIGRKNHHLVCHVGPGDTPEPVLTVGYPEDF